MSAHSWDQDVEVHAAALYHGQHTDSAVGRHPTERGRAASRNQLHVEWSCHCVELWAHVCAVQVLYTPMPVIWMQPVDVSAFNKSTPAYSCPLYKTAERRGVLSTTGHSTNFVLDIRLPTGSVSPDHWVKRGVALLTSLSS